MKRIILLLYSIIIVLLAAATWIEHTHTTAFVAQHIYHTWWFCSLWAVLTALLVATIVKFKLWHRVGVCMLHGSFIVILAGAFTTYVTSRKGYVHLEPDVPVGSFLSDDNSQSYPLPFTLTLNNFSVKCYDGTDTPADYVSQLTIIPANADSIMSRTLSMNRILTIDGYRLYQSSYDEEGGGSWLSVNYDPYGTALTYTGYALLFIAMLITLCSKHEEFRRLLRHPLLKKGGLICLMLFASMPAQLNARNLPAFNRQKADSLATRQIVYNGRVAPFNTLARDFVLKIYGSSSYQGLTPEQVVSGWLLRPDAWQNEPMFYIKNAELRSLLHIDGKYARFTDLFDAQGNYLLQHYWKGGNTQTEPNDPLQKAIMETDEKVGLIMMLQKGTLITPLPTDGSVEPLSATHIQAELLYNRLPISKVLFMVNLALGFLAFGRLVYRNIYARTATLADRYLLPSATYLSTLLLLFSYGLRWYVAGHIPMSNGFETMQFMALITLVVSCLLHRRFAVMLPFGLLLSGFALLVSHLMPVLASPWLSLHVSVVMMGYSLLAFVMLTGIMGLCVKQQAESLMLLGRLLLYPAVFFLGIGIFLGAVWANQSWGSYWSWDPKEVWALITFMIYALGFHSQSVAWMRSARHFHLFSVLAFAAVLITYFGVNFLLGGMHSYAA